MVSKFTDSVQAKVNNFFSNGVVTSSIVVGSIFFASDELGRMEQLAVFASLDGIDDVGFQINKNYTTERNKKTTERVRKEVHFGREIVNQSTYWHEGRICQSQFR